MRGILGERERKKRSEESRGVEGEGRWDTGEDREIFSWAHVHTHTHTQTRSLSLSLRKAVEEDRGSNRDQEKPWRGSVWEWLPYPLKPPLRSSPLPRPPPMLLPTRTHHSCRGECDQLDLRQCWRRERKERNKKRRLVWCRGRLTISSLNGD